VASVFLPILELNEDLPTPTPTAVPTFVPTAWIYLPILSPPD